ncbi:GNAT family N-acetyltransferase [Thermoplasma sp.]|uniref:GNAT family N-acetyltransferase n=1 Tax=Thermoplasma sp. TaxID=1973142 RepID=UPI001283289D|nr:GNAT family protein [Thermoplasma sp.]KAA8922319.1 MAG: GNAT family N-acetyltransferase [Thermoplasma sp.]
MKIRSARMNLEIEEPIDISYADDIADLANDRELVRSIGSHSFPYPYTREDAIYFIESQRSYGSEVFRVDFLIKFEGRPAGVIGLSEINRTDSNAHVGYWVGKKFRGKGIATEALHLIVKYSRDMKIHRLYTSVVEFNFPSMIVLMRNGFRIEGRESDAIRIGGRYYDFIKFARLNI